MFKFSNSWPSAWPVAYSSIQIQIFDIGLGSMDQKFHDDDENFENFDFESGRALKIQV
jgi:hypothetical protein